jgi:hypothetical protein
MDALEQMIDRLDGDEVQGELWVDGSFLTQKIDPADVDVVFHCEAAFYDNAPKAQRDIIDTIHPGSYALVDAYRFYQWPTGHLLWPFGRNRYDYWLGWFSHGRAGGDKGLAAIRLGLP